MTIQGWKQSIGFLMGNVHPTIDSWFVQFSVDTRWCSSYVAFHLRSSLISSSLCKHRSPSMQVSREERINRDRGVADWDQHKGFGDVDIAGTNLAQKKRNIYHQDGVWHGLTGGPFWLLPRYYKHSLVGRHQLQIWFGKSLWFSIRWLGWNLRSFRKNFSRNYQVLFQAPFRKPNIGSDLPKSANEQIWHVVCSCLCSWSIWNQIHIHRCHSHSRFTSRWTRVRTLRCGVRRSNILELFFHLIVDFPIEQFPLFGDDFGILSSGVLRKCCLKTGPVRWGFWSRKQREWFWREACFCF